MKILRLFSFMDVGKWQVPAVVLLFCGSMPASAALVTVESFYTDRNTASSQTITSTAMFDDAGLTGVGLEKIQLSSIDFFFTSVGFTQSPLITPQVPDGSGNYLQGTFLAIYQDGVFDYLASEGGTGGFAQPSAEVFPPIGPLSPVWVYLEQGGILQRIGFTGIGRYKLERQDIVPPVSAIPLPAAAWLFASALLGLFGLRRRASGGGRFAAASA